MRQPPNRAKAQPEFGFDEVIQTPSAAVETVLIDPADQHFSPHADQPKHFSIAT
jgi:hypothetical protein